MGKVELPSCLNHFPEDLLLFRDIGQSYLRDRIRIGALDGAMKCVSFFLSEENRNRLSTVYPASIVIDATMLANEII